MKIKLVVPWWIVAIMFAYGPDHQAQHNDVGTLILIGVTATSITIASDSASYTEGEELKTGVEKIFPIGEFGACLFGGASRLQKLELGQVVDEEAFMSIAVEWIRKNPRAGIRDAFAAITRLEFESIKRFKHRHPEFIGDQAQSSAYVTCIGYDGGTPMIFNADYYAPAGAKMPPSMKPVELAPEPGFFFPLGRDKVTTELLFGKRNAFLSQKRHAAVRKFKDAHEKRTRHLLKTEDFLRLSEVCRSATESEEARHFDHEAFQVAPPNRYAVIDATTGFRWLRTIP